MRHFADLVQKKLKGTSAYNPAQQAKLIRTEYYAGTLPLVSTGYRNQEYFNELLAKQNKAVAGVTWFDKKTMKQVH